MVLETGSSVVPKIILKYSRILKTATAETRMAIAVRLPSINIHKIRGASMRAVIHRLMCCMTPSRIVFPWFENF